MVKIGFIGFGDLGKQICNHFLKEKYSEKEIFIFDDLLNTDHTSAAFSFNDFLNSEHNDLAFIVSIGYKHLSLKNSIFNRLITHERTIKSFTHPSCFVSSDCRMEAGTIIYPLCNIDFGVSLGFGVLLNNSVTISHDSKIGNCSYLSPGVVVSGKVSIGENCFIGAGSIIADNVTIGNNVIIGIGTVVTTDVSDNTFAIGNPMRTVNHLELR